MKVFGSKKEIEEIMWLYYSLKKKNEGKRPAEELSDIDKQREHIYRAT